MKKWKDWVAEEKQELTLKILQYIMLLVLFGVAFALPGYGLHRMKKEDMQRTEQDSASELADGGETGAGSPGQAGETAGSEAADGQKNKMAGGEDTGNEDAGSGDTGSGDTGSEDTGNGETGNGETDSQKTYKGTIVIDAGHGGTQLRTGVLPEHISLKDVYSISDARVKIDEFIQNFHIKMHE